MAAKGSLSDYKSIGLKSYHSSQDINMISNLISQSQPQTRFSGKLQNQTSTTLTHKAQTPSRSYANKIKQRQNKRVIPRFSQITSEANLRSNHYLSPDELIIHQKDYKVDSNRIKDSIPDSFQTSDKSDLLESGESSVRHKTSQYSDASCLSYNRTPQEEVLLNIVSPDKAKMQLPISPIKKSPRGSRAISPAQNLHDSFMKDYDRINKLEKKLFDQNERFVLLERKYREAMTRKTRLEIFYEDMIKKLTRELQDLQNASGSVMRIDIEEIVKSVLSEVNDLHSKVTSIEDKIKTCVINFS
jgi:hypothetical protein